MKKTMLIVIGFMFLLSCKKHDTAAAPKNEAGYCKELSATTEEIAAMKAKGNGSANQRMTWNAGQAVILLDFDGQTVSGTEWNTTFFGGNDKYFAPTVYLTTANKAEIVQRVADDFKSFFCLVTTDSTQYLLADPYARMRVIVSPTYITVPGWSGWGVAYRNSATWGFTVATPCFVHEWTTSAKGIANVISHEVGHSMDMPHWATYSGTTFVNDANAGTGIGVNDWAPIMGGNPSAGITTFGPAAPTSVAWNDYVDEYSKISSVCTYMIDNTGSTISDNYYTQYGLAFSNSTSIVNILQDANDADMFYYSSLSQPWWLKVEPNAQVVDGCNVDFAVDLYDISGTLLMTKSNATDGCVGGNIGGPGLGLKITNPNVRYIRIRASGTNANIPAGCERGEYVLTTY